MLEKTCVRIIWIIQIIQFLSEFKINLKHIYSDLNLKEFGFLQKCGWIIREIMKTKRRNRQHYELHLPWCTVAAKGNTSCIRVQHAGFTLNKSVYHVASFNDKILVSVAFCLSVCPFSFWSCLWTHHNWSWTSSSTAIWRSMVSFQLQRSFRGTAHRSTQCSQT